MKTKHGGARPNSGPKVDPKRGKKKKLVLYVYQDSIDNYRELNKNAYPGAMFDHVFGGDPTALFDFMFEE